jgi:hypothetical protein
VISPSSVLNTHLRVLIRPMRWNERPAESLLAYWQSSGLNRWVLGHHLAAVLPCCRLSRTRRVWYCLGRFCTPSVRLSALLGRCLIPCSVAWRSGGDAISEAATFRSCCLSVANSTTMPTALHSALATGGASTGRELGCCQHSNTDDEHCVCGAEKRQKPL